MRKLGDGQIHYNYAVEVAEEKYLYVVVNAGMGQGMSASCVVTASHQGHLFFLPLNIRSAGLHLW